jgi:hypothetical protein
LALLLAHIYEVFPLVCPLCGAEMRIIDLLTDPGAVFAILAHVGEPTAPPRWDLPNAGASDCDRHPQPAPDYEFDQRVTW